MGGLASLFQGCRGFDPTCIAPISSSPPQGMGCTHCHCSQQRCSGPAPVSFLISHPSLHPPAPELRNSLYELVTASPGAHGFRLQGQIEALSKQVNDLTPFRGDLPLNLKVWTSYGRREFDLESTQLRTRERNAGLCPRTGDTRVGDAWSTQLPQAALPDPARAPAQSKEQDPSGVLGCAGCRLERGAASGLLSAPPRGLQHLPTLVTCCHLVPPRHKCWGPGVLKVGRPVGEKAKRPWGPHPRHPWPQAVPLVLQRTTFTWFSKQASDLSPAYGVKARTPNISQPPGHPGELFPLRQVAVPGMESGGGLRGVPEQLGNGNTKHLETSRAVDNRNYTLLQKNIGLE